MENRHQVFSIKKMFLFGEGGEGLWVEDGHSCITIFFPPEQWKIKEFQQYSNLALFAWLRFVVLRNFVI